MKLGNREVVNASQKRLHDVAGFQHVLEPMPMRNSNNAVVYYLFFASQQPVASKVVQEIFASYRNRGGIGWRGSPFKVLIDTHTRT